MPKRVDNRIDATPQELARAVLGLPRDSKGGRVRESGALRIALPTNPPGPADRIVPAR